MAKLDGPAPAAFLLVMPAMSGCAILERMRLEEGPLRLSLVDVAIENAQNVTARIRVENTGGGNITHPKVSFDALATYGEDEYAHADVFYEGHTTPPAGIAPRNADSLLNETVVIPPHETLVLEARVAFAAPLVPDAVLLLTFDVTYATEEGDHWGWHFVLPYYDPQGRTRTTPAGHECGGLDGRGKS